MKKKLIILPCPICNKLPILETGSDFHEPRLDCDNRGYGTHSILVWGKTESDVIKRWNKLAKKDK